MKQKNCDYRTFSHKDCPFCSVDGKCQKCGAAKTLDIFRKDKSPRKAAKREDV
jgi:hypothetical protein